MAGVLVVKPDSAIKSFVMVKRVLKISVPYTPFRTTGDIAIVGVSRILGSAFVTGKKLTLENRSSARQSIRTRPGRAAL